VIYLAVLLLALTGFVLYALLKRRAGGGESPEGAWVRRRRGLSRALAWKILGYASAQSVYPGDALAFYVRLGDGSSGGQFKINIYRVGTSQQSVLSDVGNAKATKTPPKAYRVGCNWPEAWRLTVPVGWKSGIYVARLSLPSAPDESTEVVFVVKGRKDAPARILIQIPTATYEAYNYWGDKDPHCLYDIKVDGKVIKRSPEVSFNRPCMPASTTSTWDASEYEDFAAWLEANKFQVDFAVSQDIHDPQGGAAFLSRYKLLVSVLHDEYWSKEMRDNVEGFRDGGGNVCFFSGNVCWWQVRFKDAMRTLVCYKGAGQISEVDPEQGVLRTTNWFKPPVNRPENTMTGVSFRNGAWWDDSEHGAMEEVPYKVRKSGHWVFKDTGLDNGDEFGVKDAKGSSVTSIVGYETDAARYVEAGGQPKVTGEDQTPLDFVILATAELSKTWSVEWAEPPSQRRATMGLYVKGGTVFTAGTIYWIYGLRPGVDNSVHRITRNLFNALG
jgi:hypothetical protein